MNSQSNDGGWKLEYQQAVEAFRAQYNILTQALSVLFIINVTVVGYAISQQKTGPFLLGAIITALLEVVLSGHRRAIAAIIYRAIVLEFEYLQGPKSLISLFTASFYSPEIVHAIIKISKKGDAVERYRGLKSLQLLFARNANRYLIITAVIGQVSLVPIVNILFHWPLA